MVLNGGGGVLTWTRGTKIKAVEGCCDADLKHHTNDLMAGLITHDFLQCKTSTKSSWHSWAALCRLPTVKAGGQHHA